MALTTTQNAQLQLSVSWPLEASNAGLFVSRGKSRHPERVINSFELIFVSRGVLELQEAGQAFSVQAGETLVLWPNRRHGATADYRADLSFYWLHFYLHTDTEADTSQANTPQTDPLPPKSLQADTLQGDVLQIPQHTRISRPDRLTNLFRRFLDDQESLTVKSPVANLLILLMLYEVVGPHPSDRVQGTADSTAALLAKRANTLISTQFHKPLSTSKLAKQLYCNPDYLGRVFRQLYGLTLTEALHQRRLKHARKLLLEDAPTTEAVARACGFNDAGYFRRVFKRAEGMTPYAFRKLYSKVYVNTE